MIDVVDGCRSVAEHRSSVGIDGSRTCRRITTGKHGIVDDDAVIIQTYPSQRVAALALQRVHGVGGNILTNRISTVGNAETSVGQDVAISIQAGCREIILL